MELNDICARANCGHRLDMHIGGCTASVPALPAPFEKSGRKTCACEMFRQLLCPYCERPTELVDRRRWVCKPCGARVGCHPGTTTPLGIPANEETRGLRVLVHRNFDKLWMELAQMTRLGRGQARKMGYAWLAMKLRIEPKDCHVGMFDAERCGGALLILRAASWMDVGGA